jgi:signal transduction histidine kinase
MDGAQDIDRVAQALDFSDHVHLLDLYERMIGDVDIQKVLLHVTEVVQEKLNAEAATIYLVREETRELESVAPVGNVNRLIRLPIREESLSGFCAMARRAFVVSDAYDDLGHVSPKLRFDRTWDKINNFRTRDVMCAPAVFNDTIYGVVQVINHRGEPFSDADLPPLMHVTRLVAYALYHAQMYEEISTLRTLDKQKAEFMRIMVHELKSPVSGSRMLATALSFANKGNSKIVEMAEKIGGRMDQLLGLIEDILQLSSVKSGKPLGEIEVFDIVPETRSGCELYADQAEAKGLDVTVDLGDTPLPIRFDRKGYALVVSNLVSNAVKYTPQGSVGVTLRRNKGAAVLSVSDTGLGIPETDVPKLFEEFFRASNVRAGDINGTGVGLAGVKQLVERFGGVMELQTTQNEGSTFIVRLPISKA